MKFFAFLRTWLPTYMFLKEGHVFSFFNKMFSMQIKNFSWGLSSEKREFSSEKVVFLSAYWYLLHYFSHSLLTPVIPCKFSINEHIHMLWVAQWKCLIDLSTLWKTGCGSENLVLKKKYLRSAQITRNLPSSFFSNSTIFRFFSKKNYFLRFYIPSASSSFRFSRPAFIFSCSYEWNPNQM